jgi:hypothetical protein
MSDAGTSKATLEQSRQLLIGAIELLELAVPLAFKQLRTGQVDLSDQRYFWTRYATFEALLEDTEPDFGEVLWGGLCDEPREATLDELAAAMREADYVRREGEHANQ